MIYIDKNIDNPDILDFLNNHLKKNVCEPKNYNRYFDSKSLFYAPHYNKLRQQLNTGKLDNWLYSIEFTRHKSRLKEDYQINLGELDMLLKADNQVMHDRTPINALQSLIDSTKILHIRQHPEATISNLRGSIQHNGCYLDCHIDLYKNKTVYKIIRNNRIIVRNTPNFIERICNVEYWLLNKLGIEVDKFYAIIMQDRFRPIFITTTSYQLIEPDNLQATEALINRQLQRQQTEINQRCDGEFRISTRKQYNIYTKGREHKLYTRYSEKEAKYLLWCCSRAKINYAYQTYGITISYTKDRLFIDKDRDLPQRMIHYVRNAEIVERQVEDYMCKYGCLFRRHCEYNKKS
jgi:hypothetical protein